MKKDKLNPRLLQFARDMRHEGAPAEKILWSCLRDRQLNGLELRRQRPTDCFVVDFVCMDEQLIVELDGDTPRSYRV